MQGLVVFPGVPDHELVVVAARGKQRAVWGPLEAADLLAVPFVVEDGLSRPQVVVVDLAVLATGAEQVGLYRVPFDDRDPGPVLLHLLHNGVLREVAELDCRVAKP